jgi:NADPH:quinone reductase-like Zn-dependent oxidoreductase
VEVIMHAALVTAFDTPPVYTAVPEPVAEGLPLTVVAAGLHPRVRSQADGSHYTSTGALPLVPGIDGVGRDQAGALRYFVVDDDAPGSMAERTVVDERRSVVLPDGADPVVIAAAMNPAMSSWVALRRRIAFEPGMSVLVLGSTGSAGRMAMQVARRLGASRVIGASRRGLPDPAADVSVTLDQVDPEVDVVLDYVWGAPAADAMAKIVTGRSDRSRPLTWVEIGSVAGPTAAIPSAALRAAKLQIVGSGQGSVSTRDIVAELGELAAEITAGTFTVDVRAMSLAEVGSAWTTTGTERIVLVP